MSIVEITFAQGPLVAEAPSGMPGGTLNEIIFDAVAWDGERPVTEGWLGVGAWVTIVSNDFPKSLIERGKAGELRSKIQDYNVYLSTTQPPPPNEDGDLWYHPVENRYYIFVE